MNMWDNIVFADSETNDESVADTEIVQNAEIVNYLPNPKSKQIIYITKSGAFIKFSDLNDDFKIIKKIENYFTIRTLQLFGNFRQSKRCRVDKKNKRIIVPRFGIFEIIDKYPILNSYTTSSNLNMGIEPSMPFIWRMNFYNNNQKIIAEHIINTIYTPERVKKGSAGLILNLEAGQGKSYLAAYLMSIIKRKTAIVMHTTALLGQWEKVLKECYKDIKIGFYYGKQKTDGDVILMIIDSALSTEFKIEMNGKSVHNALDYYNQFGFIVFDECHEYANNNDSKVFRHAQAPYMLGLSATPDENIDGFDQIVWWDLGPILKADEIPGYVSNNVEFTAKVNRIMYYGPFLHTKLIKNEITDMVNVAGTVNMVCADKHRDFLVIDCIKKCIEEKHNTFVFADRREYLEKLRLLLKNKMSIDSDIIENEDEYMRIVGGTKQEVLSRAEKAARVIFSTYQYIGTGKSIPRMTALVLATPRKSKMKQYIGRIFRLGSDTSIERKIYDIVDMKTSLKNQFTTRKKYYKEKGYAIVESKVKYEEYNIEVEEASEKVKKIAILAKATEEASKTTTKVESKVLAIGTAKIPTDIENKKLKIMNALINKLSS